MNMGISNFTLERLFIDIKDSIINSKIERIFNISDTSYIFSLYKEGKCIDLLLSLDPSLPLMLINNKSAVYSINQSNNQTNILKKYFDHGTILDLYKVQNDRIVIFKIKKWTQDYQLIETQLIFELFPLSPNIIVTNLDNVILDALKKSISLDSKHPIIKGLRYTFPECNDKTITINTTLDEIKNKVNKVEFKYLSSLDELSYKNALNQIINSNYFYLYKNNLSILKMDDQAKLITINELFNSIKDKKSFENKQDKFSNIFKLVEQKIKSLNKKLINLDNDEKSFSKSTIYLNYGQLLYQENDLYHKGDKEIIINEIKIPLDSKLNLHENAQKYFKLYKKSKTGIEQIKIQKEIANDELDYFRNIEKQIKFASNEDMQEIMLDLYQNNYLKNSKIQKKEKLRPANKKYQPHFIKLNNGIKIGYGLSSYQNEELTFSLAKKDDFYFHVKDFHGPHVILFNNNPNDEEILIAGEIALYFASLGAGEVYYTQRKDVKKVPGKRGLVTLKNQKLIVINGIRESTIKLLTNK